MRVNLFHLLIVLLNCYLVSTQSLDCPAGWVSSRTDKSRPCYLITNKLLRTWQAAQTFCSQMGGFLWKIDNAVEKTWVYNLLKVYHGYYPTHTEWWIGLHDNPAQTGVIWTDRTQPNMQLLHWVPGEPQNYDHTKACVQYYNGSLRHDDCQQEKYFICERPRTSAVFCDARHNWESISSSCYKVITKLRTWDDARAECQKEDADLMVVKDSETETVLFNFIESRKTDMWFGLRAFKSNATHKYEYHWQTNRGQPLNNVYSYWSSQYQQTGSALTAVTTSAGNLSCVIANHTIGSTSQNNFWQPTYCGIRAFGLCQKSIGRCASGWISHRGTCYQVVNRYHTTWNNANNYCKQQGANLLYIPYTSTQIYINQLLKGLKTQGMSSTWIGLSDTEVDGTWKWSNGQTIAGFSYTNYGGSTPQNTVNTPDCFQIFTDDVNGTWQIATSCNVNNSFICQIGQGQSPKVPTPPPGAATTRPQPGTTSAPVTWSTDCGPMWVKDSVTNYCYKFNDNTLTWDQAQADCKSQGAQLTSISNYHEERFISDHLVGYTSPALWIGMNSLNVHQGYHWIDGAGFGYINWAPGEPNNVGNNERCGEIIASGSNNGMWNDVPCDQRRSYVCKRKSKGEPNNANYNEHCAEIIPRGPNKGKWNDNNCNQKRGYICMKQSKDFPTMPAPTTPSVPAGKIFGCPSSDWYSYKSNCYLVKQTAMSWSDARTFCQQKGTGSELASIADENEQNFVFSQLPRVTGYRDQFWIGLNDMDVQMRFEWTDNSTVTYTRWAENEPNNYQNRPEDCVTLIQKDGMWNDEMCENPKQGFVCKVPKSIEPNNVPQMVTNTGCPQSGYVAYKYHCYKVMSSAMLPWSEALSSCTGSGGTLAVITDKYQQAFLASQIAGTSGYYWIGLTNSGSPYQWVDKSNLAYTAWSSNHTGNEVNTCVAMKSQGPGVGLWVNIQCPGRLRYICQTSRSGFSTPLIITTTTTAPPTCPSDWQDYNGYCYKAYNDDANLKTYFDARESCRSMGADLLSLHSSAEESFAFSYSVKGYSWTHYTYWIGLNDFDVEKGYKWVDGTGVNYTNWGNGEPNDSGGTDDCVEYNTIQRNWNDNSCYLSKPFICKLKKGQQLSVTKPTLPPTDAPQCGSLPNWKYFNGSCYFINSQKYGPGSRLTWFDARQYCMSQGGDLASVHSVQEAGFISVLISRTVQSDIWIGLNDLGVDQFGWTDGTPFDFMHWNGGEPNDAFGSEKCGQVIQSTGYWNDNDCNEKYHFMCKRPQGTLSTVIPTTIKPPVGGCPNGYTRVSGGGRCYKLFASRDKNQRLNYTQARDACRTFGASYDLAGINTRIEVDTLVNMVDGQILDNSDVWIGLSDLNNNRRFTWQDSSPLNSKGFATNWDKSQPQTYGGQCVVMETDQRHAGKWKNIACSNNRPYICETRQDPSISIPSQPSMCKKTDFVERNMDCYKLIPTPMSWNDAEQYCTQLQTHLVSILTVYEHAFVDTLAASMNSPVWIGMSDQQATGTYSWTDKNRIIYTKWGKNEPTYTQYGDGRCVSSYNGYWNDTQCSNTYPFVCKDPFFTPQITNTTYPGYCKVKTWKQNANFCYFVNLNGGLTYSAAEQDCTQRGMHLTSVDSRIEEIFLLNLIDADPNDSVDVWIGFRKKGGYFSWSDGTSPRYMNWAGSPQNNDCVMMHHADGKWEDDSCSHTKGYICKTNKLPATSPPPTTSTTTTTTTSTTTTSTTTTATTTGSRQPPSSSSSPSSKVVTPSMKMPVNTQSPHSVPVGRNTGRSNGVTIPRPGYQQQQQGSSSDLSGGQVSGIVIGVLALLVLICAGLLLYRKRNGGMNIPFKTFSNGSTANGLVNASYDTGYDKVSINGTNGSVKYVNGNHGNHANGDSVGFADA